LVVALDDDEESVRDRAMAIIEQQWAVEQSRSNQPIVEREQSEADSPSPHPLPLGGGEEKGEGGSQGR
jgi:hypothetical protein